MLDIDEYVARNTSAKMPWERKVVSSYLKALINSSDLVTALSFLFDTVTKEFLPNSFWRTASRYNTPRHRAILAYSMLKKDSFLFTQIQQLYAPQGFVRTFVSRELFTYYIEATDEQVLFDEQQSIGSTDMNFYTDMNTGYIYEVFINVYAGDEDNFEGIPTYSNLIKTEEELCGFLSVVKPARVNLLISRAPYVRLGSTGGTVQTSQLAQVNNSSASDYLFSTTVLNKFKKLSRSEAASIMPEYLLQSGSNIPHPATVNITVYPSSKYIKYTYYVQRDADLVDDFQNLWKHLQVSTSLGKLDFTISPIQRQVFGSIYFAKVDILLPYLGD